MKWHLFGLCARVSDHGIERGSEWVDDEWLASIIAENSNLDRIIDLPDSWNRQPAPLTGLVIPWPKNECL